MSLSDLATHISNHNSKYNRADITAVSIMLVDCIKEFLLQGFKVELGELGQFYNRIKSVGAVSASDFNAANNIIKLRAGFKPGTVLKDYLEEATFEFVPSRKNQDLLKAAQKGGADMMSLYQSPGSSNDDDEDDGGNGGNGEGGPDVYED